MFFARSMRIARMSAWTHVRPASVTSRPHDTRGLAQFAPPPRRAVLLAAARNCATHLRDGRGILAAVHHNGGGGVRSKGGQLRPDPRTEVHVVARATPVVPVQLQLVEFDACEL